MIVTMRAGISPKCTRHRVAMKPCRIGEPTGFNMQAYACDVNGCTRAYNSSRGYFDIVNEQFVQQDNEQQDCHRCDLPMYLDEVSSDRMEVWRCAQHDCDYSIHLTPNPARN